MSKSLAIKLTYRFEISRGWGFLYHLFFSYNFKKLFYKLFAFFKRIGLIIWNKINILLRFVHMFHYKNFEITFQQGTS